MSDPWEDDLIDDLRNPPVMSMVVSRDDLYTIMATRMGKAADEIERLRAENERLREALEWYKAQVGGCNRYGSDGDKCRDALAKDIGERANAAIQADGGKE